MLSPLLPLGFTPEAPVAYEANNFSRNHIKQTRCSIDCKNDIIHPLLSALYFPQTEEQSGGENLYPREILFHGDGVLSMLISTCVGFFPPHQTTMYICACSRASALQGILLWHTSFHISLLEAAGKAIYETITLERQECVEKPLTHLGRANEYETAGVCVGKRLVGGDVKGERAFGRAYFQPYKIFLFHMKF